MKKINLYQFLKIISVIIVISITACSETSEDNNQITEMENVENNVSEETKEELWIKTKKDNSYTGYINFLEKFPNDEQAFKMLIKTNEFKTKYGNFLKFFDNMKNYKDDFKAYFSHFSNKACSMNDVKISFPYTEEQFDKYLHKKLLEESEIMSFPGIGSSGVAITINDNGISWFYQSVGAGASVMVNLEWEFESDNLLITMSKIEIDHFNEGDEAMVDLSEVSDCNPKFKVEGVNDAKGYYKNSGLNASWTIHFAETGFVAFYSKDGIDDEIITVDKIERISDCEYYIIMEGFNEEKGQKWKLRYNQEKKFYDLITLTYSEELETWLDVEFEGNIDNG